MIDKRGSRPLWVMSLWEDGPGCHKKATKQAVKQHFSIVSVSVLALGLYLKSLMWNCDVQV